MTAGVDPRDTSAGSPRRWPAAVAVLVGLGLALAPLAFGMFDRAPKGGEMIDEFSPYMTSTRIEEFRDHLGEIGGARDAVAAIRRDGSGPLEAYPSVTAFEEDFPAIDADMRSMLDTMEANLGNYDGVAALPPFPLFPWFFVVPGALLAAAGAWWWRRPSGRRPRLAVLALGIGLIAAPVVFQMFGRAPGGAAMIDDFESMMRTERVTEIQEYFLTIGAAEGDLRLRGLPALREQGGAEDAELDAVASFVEQWPTISNEMAPMIGTMADNVDNFEAVVALPDFALFPWFFVLPGALLVGLFVVTRGQQAAGAGAAAGAAAPASLSLRSLRVVRAGAAIVAVGSLLTLAVLALLADTGEIELPEGFAASAPGSVTSPEPTAAPAPSTSAARPVPSTEPTASDGSPSPTGPTPAPPRPAPEGASSPSTTAAGESRDDRDAPADPEPPEVQQQCALGLPPPERSGGLASLTPLVPAFGPFAAEAFAFSPAYEPMVELFGPFLPMLADVLEDNEALVGPAVTRLRQLEQVGFDHLAPVYGPHRQDFLDAASRIADALAPHAEALRDSPAAACLLALEGMVADGAREVSTAGADGAR